MLEGEGIKGVVWLDQIEDIYAYEEGKEVVKGKGSGKWESEKKQRYRLL